MSIAEAVVQQFHKTLHKPQRLVAIPINLLSNAVGYGRAKRLLDRNDPQGSWALFQRLMRVLPPSPDDLFASGICLLVGLGRRADAMRMFANYNALRRGGLSVPADRRYLGPIWAERIGHTAQIDYAVKLSVLQGIQPKDVVLYVPPEALVANGFLLDQWAEKITVVTRERDLPPGFGALTFDLLAPERAGETMFFWDLAAETYGEWEDAGRGPLLSLSQLNVDAGFRNLHDAGLKLGQWFVALHVREQGANEYHHGVHRVLNAKISDYDAAISEILGRGGFVVRMGDPKMSRMEPREGVFDYCHSPIHSAWMDVFLCSQARFFVGTSSGPSQVPPTYGVPCVLTNYWPPRQRPWHSADLFIPKLYVGADGRVLGLAEILDEPFGFCNSVGHLEDRLGATVRDNTPEEIRDVVVEMLDRLEGRSADTPEQAFYRLNCNKVYVAHNAMGRAALGRRFLQSFGRALLN